MWLAEKGLLLFIVLLVIVALGIFTATRIVLALYTGVESVPLSSWPRFLIMGLWFDAAVLCYLLVPFLLYEAVFGNRWRPAGWQRWVRYGVFWFVTAVLLFNALSEQLFWIEFEARYNFIAVDYLVYTREVIGNIRESYPVMPLLLAVAVLAAMLTWALRDPLARASTCCWPPYCYRFPAGYSPTSIRCMATATIMLRSFLETVCFLSPRRFGAMNSTMSDGM